jgi:hypothetical protein
MSSKHTIDRAFRLWKQFKTETAEYREIAASLSMNTAELNRRCWQINHDREEAVRLARK